MANNVFTLYAANCTGNAANTSYPQSVRVTNLNSFRGKQLATTTFPHSTKTVTSEKTPSIKT
ncbi:hypothetical protein FACS189465_2000 [Clostridia bacterium]|nr:hypothetical protein FACS189465_2000 [Clostridia bacterium]